MKKTITLMLLLVLTFALGACAKSADRSADEVDPAVAETEVCRVSAAEPQKDGDSYTVTVTAENRFEDEQSFLVSVTKCNGLPVQGEAFEAFNLIPAGESKEFTFTIDSQTLADYAIKKLETVEIHTRVMAEGDELLLDDTLTATVTANAKK